MLGQVHHAGTQVIIYHPEFNLEIVEEWLPRHSVARVSISIDVLNQDDLTTDDDAEFWQSIGAIEDSKLIEIVADKQPVSPLEEVPSALHQNKVNWLTSTIRSLWSGCKAY